MKKVYAVSFRRRWEGDTEYPDSVETFNAVAADAEVAISKVRTAAMKELYVSDEDHKKHKVIAFRLAGVEEVCSIDV